MLFVTVAMALSSHLLPFPLTVSLASAESLVDVCTLKGKKRMVEKKKIKIMRVLDIEEVLTKQSRINGNTVALGYLC